MHHIYGADAYSPDEIAKRVEQVAVIKANARFVKTFMLGVLAGGFIGLGGLFYTFIVADPDFGFMPGRLLGGVFFATGYLIAILAGAEVFTSNNLLAMAVAAGRITLRQLLGNWCIVICGNAVGAFGLAILFLLSGLHQLIGGAFGETAYAIAAAKGEISLLETLCRGILGNLFVCISVWITIAGRSVADKVIGAILPLTALAALSLEHVVASLYYIPRAWLLAQFYPEYVCTEMPALTLIGTFSHLGVVTMGNIFGGSIMVASVYYLIYRHGSASKKIDQSRHSS